MRWVLIAWGFTVDPSGGEATVTSTHFMETNQSCVEVGQMIVSEGAIETTELHLIVTKYPNLSPWLDAMTAMRWDTYSCVTFEQYRGTSDRDSLKPGAS